jgi:DNA-binding PadR family transcriptional regulator
MENQMGARANPGRFKTGVSRAILLCLSAAKRQLSINEILERLGPRTDGVTHGTIWTTLDRARSNGLVRRQLRGRTYYYSLTAGGKRRVSWIQGTVLSHRAVANPQNEKKE